MRPIKKIPSFSLIELLVSIAISALLITFCYLGYKMVKGYFEVIDLKSAQANELQIFTQAFSLSVDQATYVLSMDSSIVMVNADSINTWVFKDSKIFWLEQEMHFAIGDYHYDIHHLEDFHQPNLVEGITLELINKSHENTAISFVKNYTPSLWLTDYEHIVRRN